MYLSIDVLRRAEQQIEGCERCDPRADTPFYWLLDSTVGSAGATYVLPARAHCQACGSEVGRKTRIKWS